MILHVSPHAAAHVWVALRRHRQWAATQRIRLPDEVRELEDYFESRASEGQRGTPLSDLWEFRESSRMSPQLMTYEEAARSLACSLRQVKRLVAGGALERIKIGGLARIRVADVEAFVAGGDTADDPLSISTPH